MIKTDKEMAAEKYARLKETYPNIDEDMMEVFINNMPVQALNTLEEYEYKHGKCNHIMHREDYDRYAEAIHGGPHWKVEDIEKASGICFAHKRYTKYDFAYTVNYLYALFKHFKTDPREYIRMATAVLENPMLEDADDFAYNMATSMIHS